MITVEHGALSGVKVSPEVVEVVAGQSQKLIAEAVDTYDNIIPEAQITWEVAAGVGTISSSGVLTATTEVGSFPNGVMVTAIFNNDSAETTAPVTVTHGPLDRVKLSPAAVELATGQSQEFTAELVDAYDNTIPEAQITWEVTAGVGAISSSGALTAGTNTGTFHNGVMVTAELNGDSAESTASITIIVLYDDLVINSISPPDGTTLSAGQSVEVTANVSYSLASSSHADIVLLFQNEISHFYQFAQYSVSEGSGDITITGRFTVPNRHSVGIMAHIRLPDYTQPVSFIAVTYSVEGAEVSDAAATIPGVISDPEGDVGFDSIDIINVEVTLDGDGVVAQIQLSELPEQLTFNQAPENRVEYMWNILFDIDGDPGTGSQFGQEGYEYLLSVRHWVRPGAQVELDTLLGTCESNVWVVKEDGGYRPLSEASASVDYATNTLTIRGAIPGLNTDSRWWAEASYWDSDSERQWQDMAPDTRFTTLD
jgi:hypothetical protein